MAKDKNVKPKAGKKAFATGINSVTIVGTCQMGGVTVQADVVVPGGSTGVIVSADIVAANNPTGPALASGPLTLTTFPSTYSGRLMGISGSGPFKARVNAYWFEPHSSGPVLSGNFNCQAGPGPIPASAGDDDCCG